MSKLYSLILLPLAPCSFSILLNTISSFSALGRQPTTLFFPHSSLGTTKDNDIPVLPARAVRPTLWVYDRDVVGRSKFRTHATSTKSTPRVTPYSLSLPLSFRSRLRDFVGAGEPSRLRFLVSSFDELGSEGVSRGSTGSGSRCVEVTEQKCEDEVCYMCIGTSNSHSSIAASSSSSSSSVSYSVCAPLSSVAMI